MRNLVNGFAAAMALGAIMGGGIPVPTRAHSRMGPGRKTLYTIWKKLDQSKTYYSEMPNPLTRQVRRALDRQVAKLHRRRTAVENRAKARLARRGKR